MSETRGNPMCPCGETRRIRSVGGFDICAKCATVQPDSWATPTPDAGEREGVYDERIEDAVVQRLLAEEWIREDGHAVRHAVRYALALRQPPREGGEALSREDAENIVRENVPFRVGGWDDLSQMERDVSVAFVQAGYAEAISALRQPPREADAVNDARGALDLAVIGLGANPETADHEAYNAYITARESALYATHPIAGAGERDTGRALDRLNAIAKTQRELADLTGLSADFTAAEDFECAAEAISALRQPPREPRCSCGFPLANTDHHSSICGKAPTHPAPSAPARVSEDAVLFTAWLIEKREHARAQLREWSERSTDDVQGNPVEQMGYWRGYDDALGDLMARRVNQRTTALAAHTQPEAP